MGTGFNDAFLQKVTEELKLYQHGGVPSDYAISKLKPDVYFSPTKVWEISFDTYTPSSLYLLDENLGVSVRFPCFNRIRTDKSINEATTTEEIIEMYNRFTEFDNTNTE